MIHNTSQHSLCRPLASYAKALGCPVNACRLLFCGLLTQPAFVSHVLLHLLKIILNSTEPTLKQRKFAFKGITCPQLQTNIPLSAAA